MGTTDAKLTGLFIDMLAAEQGAGPNTLDAYRRDLTDFSDFLGRSDQSFAGAETQMLRDYLADLDTRGFKSSSVARRLRPPRRSGCAACGSIACSKCCTPPVCAYRNWSRCRYRQRGATRG